MPRRARSVLEDLARSTIGALNLGMPLLYTMETWWLAWRLPLWILATFAFIGVIGIVVADELVGFQEDAKKKRAPLPRLVQSVVELILSTLAAALVVLFLFGIVEWGDPLGDLMRHGLIQLVPLGLGASIANIVFRATDNEEDPPTFLKEMATFALGAAFFAFSIAPTEEMELMAAHAGWWRLAFVVLFTIAFTYVVLYVIEFRGHRGRMAGMESAWLRIGETMAGYAVALAVSAFLLFGYGHFQDAPFALVVQETVVLSLVAAFGGAAARVVV